MRKQRIMGLFWITSIWLMNLDMFNFSSLTQSQTSWYNAGSQLWHCVAARDILYAILKLVMSWKLTRNCFLLVYPLMRGSIFYCSYTIRELSVTFKTFLQWGLATQSWHLIYKNLFILFCWFCLIQRFAGLPPV